MRDIRKYYLDIQKSIWAIQQFPGLAQCVFLLLLLLSEMLLSYMLRVPL